MSSAAEEGLPQELPPSVVRAWLVAAGRPYVGWVLIGIGVLCLLLGWYGVSGTPVVAKQLPYLASGGLAGLAFIVLGARLLMIEDLRRDSGRLDRLERMVADLHAVLLEREERAAQTAPAPTATLVSVLPGATTYHRDDCPMLEGKDSPSKVRLGTATRRGLTPCPLCEPTASTAVTV